MNILAKPDAINQLVLHVPTGERYVFRIQQGRVTGCLGSRNRLQWRATDLMALNYDERPELAQWADERWHEFDLTG